MPPLGLEDAGLLPAQGGAYALILCLDCNCEVIRRGMTEIFSAGWYVYAGSAYGPGGIRARLSRHLERKKTVRWHVDQLSVAAGDSAGLPIPGGNECAIVEKLSGTGCFEVPSPGFGSSDCRACVSHLLRFSA